MKSIHCPYLGLFALLFALSMRAQPILISPQNQTIGANSVSNLRILKQTPDGAETVLTVEFSYDGMSGATARIIPVITDKNQPKASAWFGADPVSVGTGHGTVSLRVRFFNDEPGVPPELTTDHVRVMMLSEGGNAIISQGIFSRTIKWGNPNATAATSPPPENQAQTPLQSEEKANAEAKVAEEARLKAIAEEKARQVAEAKRVAEEKAKAEAKAAEEARLRTIAEEKARQEAEAKRIADEKAKAEAKAAEEARLKAIAEEKARQEAEAKRVANEKAKAEAKAAE
jgi:flagellar biosynthesis GTPase FlhF